jgi:signal transduction histidine kinase
MAKSIRLVKRFSLASLVAVLIVAFVLASFYAWKARSALVEQGEFKNSTQVRLILNQLDASERAVLDELFALKQKPAADAPVVQRMLQTFARSVSGTSIVKLKLYNARGLTVFSSEVRQIGEDKASYPGFVAALHGTATSQLSERESFESFFGTLGEVAVIGSYLPVRDKGGVVIGVIEVYDDVTQLFAAIKAAQWEVFGLSAVLMSALYIALLIIVRRADSIVTLNEQALEREIAQRARIASEANRAQQATEKAQRETEKAYASAMAARRLAEEASQAKTEFLGRLSEEMRTPLNGVIGTTDVLLTGDLSAPQRENLVHVRAGAASLLRLLDDLLETTQPDSENHEPRWEALSPLAVAREATTLHASLAKKNGLVLDCRAANSVPAWALGDARRLRLVLTDLVGIAGRSGRGKTVLIAIERVTESPGLVLRYSVRVDRVPAGQVMEPEALDLKAARRIAAKLDGTIELEAAEGQPMVLRLTLPLRPATLENAAEATTATPTAAVP